MGAAAASTATYLLARRRPDHAALPGQPPREPGRHGVARAGGGADVKRLLLGALVVPALLLGSCLAHDRSGEQMATVSPTPSASASTGPTGRPADRSATRALPPAQGTTIVASPLASGDPYADLARQLHARGVDIWFEADLVKRWLEGPAAFQEGLDRLGAAGRGPRRQGLQGRRRARLPGRADLARRRRRTSCATYAPGSRSGPRTRRCWSTSSCPTWAACGWTAAGSTSCAERAVASAPAASAAAVGGYLRGRAGRPARPEHEPARRVDLPASGASPWPARSAPPGRASTRSAGTG